MADERTSLEIIAPTIEEAVKKGLADLGLPEDAVDIEVLDAGSRGLFGLGTRHARVRLTMKGSESYPEQAVATTTVVSESISTPAAPAASFTPLSKAPAPVVPQEPVAYPPPAVRVAPAEKTEEDFQKEEEALYVARETVIDLLKKMKVTATVMTYYAEPDDEKSRQTLWVDVRGKDLSILIGPHAETLNALQYIAGLIVSKELDRSVPLVVDVEGYRVRRAQEVRRLARRMADQAVKTGRRQFLEPMPASERRLVHIELRNNPDVTTESTGDDPHRKVTIVPK